MEVYVPQKDPKTGLFGRITLVRAKFPDVSVKDFSKGAVNPLTDEDLTQIASAVARERGIPQGECSFEFVPY